jgi:hypothetical protein
VLHCVFHPVLFYRDTMACCTDTAVDNGANGDGCNGAKGMRKAPTAKERRATKTASKKQVCMPTPAAALPTLCSTLC